MIGLGLSIVQLAVRQQLAFNPASFFANGEQGWWYDPSNFATLFQDSAGTTPVTAMEQPVGLQLDLSKGLVLGPELVTNGDFSDPVTTGWTVTGGTLSVVDGWLRLTSSVSPAFAAYSFPTVIGASYRFSGSWRSSAGTWRLIVGTTAGGNQIYAPTAASSGSVDALFVATATTTLISVRSTVITIGDIAEIDNITVKELPGNHRFQTTSANRPVVSARVNLLTKTEQLTDSAWVKTAGVTVTDNAAVAPDGTTTATNIAFGATNREIAQSFAATNGGTTPTFYVKGTAGQVLNFGAGGQDRSITLTGGWDLASSTLPAGIAKLYIGNYTVGANALNISVWHPDIRSSTQGVNLPAYQRVNTSTDYDTTGFPVYIKPNGSNQFMQTNSINFTATDKMTVWQGVRKLGTSFQMVSETSSSAAANGGAFFIGSSVYQADDYAVLGSGVGFYVRNYVAFSSPITNVLTASMNNAGATISDEVSLRVNGALATVGSTSIGAATGNFGNYPAYFYARAGTSLYFNGNDYGSIARGAASTAAQIAAGETYINSKTKAYTP